MAIFQVAGTLLPAAVTGLVMAAIMAAIMSTADSLLLQTGSIASRDLFERFFRPYWVFGSNQETDRPNEYGRQETG